MLHDIKREITGRSITRKDMKETEDWKLLANFKDLLRNFRGVTAENLETQN
jgi:hypothetical protein